MSYTEHCQLTSFLSESQLKGDPTFFFFLQFYLWTDDSEISISDCKNLKRSYFVIAHFSIFGKIFEKIAIFYYFGLFFLINVIRIEDKNYWS